MRTLIATLFLSAALVACGGEEKPAEPAPAPAPAPEPAPAPAPVEAAAFDAAAAYKTTCATCHGEAGKGDGVAGAALNPKPANFSDPEFWKTRDDAAITKAIKEGGAAVGKSALMAPWGGTYTDEQIAKLVEHVKTFKPAT